MSILKHTYKNRYMAFWIFIKRKKVCCVCVCVYFKTFDVNWKCCCCNFIFFGNAKFKMEKLFNKQSTQKQQQNVNYIFFRYRGQAIGFFFHSSTELNSINLFISTI